MPSVRRARSYKYNRIANELRSRVASLPPGTRLPTERDLAKRFDCNVLTVRKGLSQLVDEGRIERRVGSGTFVAGAAAIPAGPEPRTTTDTIGVLAVTQMDVYGHRVLQALGTMAAARDITLKTAWIDGFQASARQQVRELAGSGCSALVLPWFPHDMTEAVAEFARCSPIPISLPLLLPGLERLCFEAPSCFGRSTLTCTEALCHYFVERGHRQIALLGPTRAYDPILQARLTAYSCAMSELGLETICGLIGPETVDTDALAQRWAQYRGDLAIVAYDDTHALRLIMAMHKLGLNAPTDFTIVGFNNIEAAPFCDPPLSSLDQDFDYIGRAQLRSALALGRGELEQSTEPPPHHLLVRESCGGVDGVTAALAAAMRGRGLVLADDTGAPLTFSD